MLRTPELYLFIYECTVYFIFLLLGFCFFLLQLIDIVLSISAVQNSL